MNKHAQHDELDDGYAMGQAEDTPIITGGNCGHIWYANKYGFKECPICRYSVIILSVNNGGVIVESCSLKDDAMEQIKEQLFFK